MVKRCYFPNLDRDCSWSSPVDSDGVQVSSDLDKDGREVPDPTPMAPPVGMSERPSLADFVQRMIQQEVSRAAAAAEMETFEEADDFDVEDDPMDPRTPYEENFDKQPPADWPMYYNEESGLYGQLPPDQKPPDGFVRLERVKQLPTGWERPAPSEARPEGNGGGRGGSSPQQEPPEPPDTTDTGVGLPARSNKKGRGQAVT